MTLIWMAAGGVMGRLHVGGNVLDCRISKLGGDFILLVRFRRSGDV